MKIAQLLAVIVAGLSLAACTVAPTRAAPERFAIGGHIVTPTGVQRESWIVIDNGRIAAIQKEKPAVPRAIDTKAYVFPGFVDLHNHPMYNIIPRWNPPHHYANRYEWRGDPIYAAATAAPQRQAVNKDFCDVDAYVELRMLMAGTTTTLGISKPGKEMPRCIETLARNLDWHMGFEKDPVVVTMLGVTEEDLRRTTPDNGADIVRQGKADLFAVHVAEGRSGDPQSRGEFALLKKEKLLTNRTAIIHGIALGPKEFDEMKEAGASLIWSPRSNMALYGETADVLAARERIRVAIAPDWSPTGSDSMLDELAFASGLMRGRKEKDPRKFIDDRTLFEMATRIPAEIAGIHREVGSLAVGLRADLFVLRNDRISDAYAALAQTGARDISLVLVAGTPVYGRPDDLSALGVTAIEPVVVCRDANKAINSAAFGTKKFADVAAGIRGVLEANGSGLAPLVELCR